MRSCTASTCASAICDGMAHVNNAVFSTYLEQARLAWFGDADPQPLADVILARTEIDFRSPVQVGEIVEIGVRPARDRHQELRARVRASGRRKGGRLS